MIRILFNILSCLWAFSSIGSEHPTHNWEVVGSIPTRPTITQMVLTEFTQDAIRDDNTRMVELVDTTDLKSVGESHEGSSPSLGTNKWWLTVPATSWHASKRRYNEDNWGIGLEYKTTNKWSMLAGTYQNSYNKQTLYLGANYTPWSFQWKNLNLNLGGTLFVASGYKSNLVILPIPTVQMEVDKKVGVDFFVGSSFIGFSLKFNLDKVL